jgi:hypothetical protein
MMGYTFWGGPLDGAQVPTVVETQPFLIVGQNNTMHYYVKCEEEHTVFEYVGEEEDDE